MAEITLEQYFMRTITEEFPAVIGQNISPSVGPNRSPIVALWIRSKEELQKLS